MSLREVMLADLECGLAIVRDGYEVVPAWRILTPENDFLILTPFDPDKPEKRQRMLGLMPRFMAWKLATGFVLTAETRLGLDSGEKAVLAIGVTHHERLGVIRRICRTPSLAFGPPNWLPSDALDDAYVRLLPSGAIAVTALEAKMLATVFGEDGELPARLAGPGHRRSSPRPS